MNTEQELNARFLEAHLPHQKTLLGYFLTAVRDFQQAEDLLQKTTLILWESWNVDGEPDSYLAWAFGIARRVVARHYRDHSTRREVVLPLEILEQVVSASERDAQKLSAESRALAGCVKKLPGELKELVRMRYEEGRSLSDVAGALGQSLAAVNMKLVRLRRALLDCSRQSLASEEA